MAEFFGKYQLHEKIAQGGMAEVFLASKKGDIGGFTRQVAIKRMFPHLVDRDEIITMFIDEARIASQLHHPNIVQIYDLGVVDGTFFIAMEFVEGYDLREVCKEGVDKGNFISRPLAVHIVSEAAAGLDYAHRQTDKNGRPMNIVHRDVSPQNVLISVDGGVKVCDFGIAKAEDRLTQTQIGEFKGKFSYMSPEQFASQGLDCRSDIFALGVVLYETTVGVRLFKARSEFETIRRITEGDFKPPSQVRPGYPSRLEEIILKCLEVDPDERYQSAALLQEDLEEWLFDRRIRTGRKHLARYLDELMDKPSPQTGAGAMGMSTGEGDGADQGLRPPERRGPNEPSLAGQPDPLDSVADDATMELGVSEAERKKLLALRDEAVTSSSNAAPTVDNLGAAVSSMEEMLAGKKAEEPQSDRRDSPTDAVEVRRISAQEAERRRQRSDDLTIEDDRTLVDEELEQDTTSPDDSAPRAVIDAGAAPAGSEQPTTERPAMGPANQSQGPQSQTGRSPQSAATGQQRPVSARKPAGNPQKKQGQQQRSGPSNTSSATAEVPSVSGAQGASEKRPPSETGPKPKADRSTDSLVAEMPDLRPGGRQLTGLNPTDEDSDETALAPDEPTSPGTDVTPSMPQFDMQRLSYIAGGFFAVLVVGIGLIVVISGDDEDGNDDVEIVDVDIEEEPEVEMTGEAVGDREVTLRLETSPGGAAVVANGVMIDGTTPLDVPLVDGRDNEIWITRRNHRPHRMLIPADGTAMEREVELERASTTDGAGVDFVSEPEGAEVYVNGELFGNAPFRMENVGADFESHVQFELDGHRPYVAFINFDPDRDNRLVAKMVEDDTVAVEGSYEFRPADSRVSLAGEVLGTTPFEHLHHREEWLELEVQGSERQTRHHRLRLDRLGGFKMAMELEREARETGRLSVEVEPASAVYVDARAFGAAPLEEVELPAGEQRVLFETAEGKRVRVPLEIEADSHRSYRVVIDGDDVDVESID